MHRGEIWEVRFDPKVGQEIEKDRPAVIINEPWAAILNLRIVVPITEWDSRFSEQPWKIQLRPGPANGLSKVSAADTFQLKSLSVQRFQRKLGVVTTQKVVDIVAAVALVIGHPYPYGQ